MTRPYPGGRPQPWPRHTEPPQPTDAQFAAYARQILAWHRAIPPGDGRVPNWCTCGAALVLCPYRAAAARRLDPPPPGTG